MIFNHFLKQDTQPNKYLQSLSDQELYNQIKLLLPILEQEYAQIAHVQENYYQQLTKKVSIDHIFHYDSLIKKFTEDTGFMKYQKEIQNRILLRRNFDRELFIKLLELTPAVEKYYNQNYYISFQIRFVLHHDRDTIDFIRQKILPGISLDEINAILYWYAKNRNEKGDLVWSPASKMIDELLERAIELMEKSENCIIKDGIVMQSHLHVLNFKTDTVVKHFDFILNKVIEKYDKISEADHDELIQLYSRANATIHTAGKFNLLDTENERYEKILKLIEIMTSLENRLDQNDYLDMKLYTIRSLAVSHIFDTPLNFQKGELKNVQFNKIKAKSFFSIEELYQGAGKEFLSKLDLDPKQLSYIENTKNYQTMLVQQNQEKIAAKMNGHTRLVHYYLVKAGVHAHAIELEALIPDTKFTVDMLIKTTQPDREHKGVVIEVNGPTHYYNPGQTEVVMFHSRRTKMLEQIGYKVYEFHHLGPEYGNEQPIYKKIEETVKYIQYLTNG